MSFQWIIDRAESISINRLRQVATSVARDGTTRAVDRGARPKTFDVRVPDGIPWTELKANIAAAEALDRISTATITIPYAKFPWYYGNVQPAQDETYTVRCIEFPQWTIVGSGQVTWSGSFVFTEAQ